MCWENRDRERFGLPFHTALKIAPWYSAKFHMRKCEKESAHLHFLVFQRFWSLWLSKIVFEYVVDVLFAVLARLLSVLFSAG